MKNQMIKNSTPPNQPSNRNLTALRMRTLISFLASLMLIVAFSSCEKDELDPIDQPDSIVPDRFRIEIPGAISSSQNLKSGQADTLNGNDVYQHLRTFIAVGEFGAELAESVMLMIAVNNLNRPLELTFISDDDGRSKHLKIIENVEFENHVWQYRLTIKDIDGDADNGSDNTAIQVFWNLNPLEGVAILNPYNIDRNTESIYKNTQFRVDYSETGNMGYETHMIVSFTGFPLPSPLLNPYAVSKMKMFVGKNGDMISLYGNSEHPNAFFFSEETGFNWAFAAAASESQNIAVAEVGLPPMTLDADDRETLLDTYSLRNVFRNQILAIWPGIDQELLDAYLYNTQAPGFFDNAGFVKAGTAPSENYLPYLDKVSTLTPYNPSYIYNMNIQFEN